MRDGLDHWPKHIVSSDLLVQRTKTGTALLPAAADIMTIAEESAARLQDTDVLLYFGIFSSRHHKVAGCNPQASIKRHPMHPQHAVASPGSHCSHLEKSHKLSHHHASRCRFQSDLYLPVVYISREGQRRGHALG